MNCALNQRISAPRGYPATNLKPRGPHKTRFSWRHPFGAVGVFIALPQPYPTIG